MLGWGKIDDDYYLAIIRARLIFEKINYKILLCHKTISSNLRETFLKHHHKSQKFFLEPFEIPRTIGKVLTVLISENISSWSDLEIYYI